jgi:guanosine-3',5'-bis(diphosphate) 3'-pyrophosphohydrolase
MAEDPQSLVLRAAHRAAEWHTHQRRKGTDDRPYINHPLDVAYRLIEVAGVSDPEVLAAAILHDTVEDTDATAQDIHSEFGPRVAALVAEVTDDKSLQKAERKRLQVAHAPHISAQAALIKISDKISNVLDLVRDPPPHWDHARKLAYLDWSEAVIGALPASHPALIQAFHEAIRVTRHALEEGR